MTKIKPVNNSNKNNNNHNNSKDQSCWGIRNSTIKKAEILFQSGNNLSVPLIPKSVLLDSAFDWFSLAICCLSTLMYDCQEYFERCDIHNNSNINHHHYHHFH